MKMLQISGQCLHQGVEALRPEVARHIDEATLNKLDVAEDYLGSADSFRIQQLRSNRPTDKKD